MNNHNARRSDIEELLSWLCNEYKVQVPKLIWKPGKVMASRNGEGVCDGWYYWSPLFRALPPVITLCESATDLEFLLAHEFTHYLTDPNCEHEQDEAEIDWKASEMLKKYKRTGIENTRT